MARCMGKVLLAMSGGVDSSVAASRLQRQGYEVTGVFLCMGQASRGEQADRACCSPQDAADARRVAQALGMDLHVLNVQERFEEIIEYFLDEYTAGRTPNPCIHCNMRLKFGRLVELADSLGLEYIATGHHARLVEVAGRRAIARAAAQSKDQAYALFAVPAEVLPRMLLPIGDIDEKARVREIARELGLVVHDKPDSQEICFVADDDYVALLRQRRPEAMRPGRIINASGEQLGRHDGYAQFTIGQRRGVGVAAGVPMYVTRIDPVTADVTIGPREEVLGSHLLAHRANWHARPTATSFDAMVQIRYNHRGAPARVTILQDDSFEVRFCEPVHAITPGQAAVIFQDGVLLGGGWIA